MFDFELAKLFLIWDQSIDTSLYYAYVLYSKYRPLPKIFLQFGAGLLHPRIEI
jgi:hypothetical protein